LGNWASGNDQSSSHWDWPNLPGLGLLRIYRRPSDRLFRRDSFHFPYRVSYAPPINASKGIGTAGIKQLRLCSQRKLISTQYHFVFVPAPKQFVQRFATGDMPIIPAIGDKIEYDYPAKPAPHEVRADIIRSMDTKAIVENIDAEIIRLQRVRCLLTGQTAPLKRELPTKHTAATARKRRTISAEGRARIAAAQRARWAKTKRK
jgi:hypothetical protein